jgi:hypothetical protein
MKWMTSPTLLVLAAGMGSRYGGLKQIDPIGPHGETIMDYSIFDALRVGFSKVVFVIRKEIEQPFKEIIGARFEKHVTVEYVFQELDKLPAGYSVPAGRTKPWGTTHAILMATDAIHEPFAAINADDFYGAEGYRVLAQHLTSDALNYAMVGFVLRNTLSDFGTVARGVCKVNCDSYLESIVELTNIEREGEFVRNTNSEGRVTRLTGNEVVSLNMWGFAPQIFEQLRDYFQSFLELHSSDTQLECYLPSAVNTFVRDGRARVKILPTTDSWFGVTYREDRSRVVDSIDRLIHDGRYPESLWS